LTKKESYKRYWLRIHVTLRSPYVSVEESESGSFNVEFRLHCRSRSFIFYAPTPDIKKDWCSDIRKSITGDHKDEIENKKVQEMTKELHKNTDSDVVRETEKDPNEKKSKVKKETTNEESGNTEKVSHAPAVTTSTHGERKSRTHKKRVQQQENLLGPPIKLFDPFAQSSSLQVPNQINASIIRSSPGNFGAYNSATQGTSFTVPTSPFAGDIFGVAAGGSHLTGSLAGTGGNVSSSAIIPANPFSNPSANPFSANPFSSAPANPNSGNPFAGSSSPFGPPAIGASTGFGTGTSTGFGGASPGFGTGASPYGPPTVGASTGFGGSSNLFPPGGAGVSSSPFAGTGSSSFAMGNTPFGAGGSVGFSGSISVTPSTGYGTGTMGSAFINPSVHTQASNNPFF